MTDQLRARASAIRLIVFDVDGVLTDGKLYYGADGSEIKAFHVHDGSALKMLASAGIQVAIITGRESAMVTRRAAELGLSLVRQGASSKLPVLNDLLAGTASLQGISLGQCACVGDDLADIPLFQAVELGISVPNGHPSARQHAHWITSVAGGHGVAREVAELLLRSQGQWPYP